jgi:two-component system response regulator DesR
VGHGSSDIAGPVVRLIAGESQASVLADILRRDGLQVANGEARIDAVVISADPSAREDRAGIAALSQGEPATPVILVSSPATGRALRDAMEAGVSGIVHDGEAPHALAPTVRAVCAGQVVLPAEMRDRFSRPPFSHREKQVLALVAMGYTNGEVAAKLCLAESTVKTHLSSCFDKLGVRSRREAAALVADESNGVGTRVVEIAQEDRLSAGTT